MSGRKARKVSARRKRARGLIADDVRGVSRHRRNELRRVDRRPPPVQEALARLSRPEAAPGRKARDR